MDKRSTMGDPQDSDQRVRRFNEAPSREQLAIVLGPDQAGTSSYAFDEDEASFVFRPSPIPVAIATVWMYFVWAICGAGMAFASFPAKTLFWICWAGAAVFVIPTMMGLFSYMNRLVGDEDYLVLDKIGKRISLPRINFRIACDEAEQVVFVDRFVDNTRLFQIGLLARRENDWVYAHICNTGGTEFGYLTQGTSKEIARRLGIASSRILLGKKESARIDSPTEHGGAPG